MTHNIPSKLPRTGTSIFAVMSALANEYNAVNLSQGFPGFDIDRQLIDLVYKYMKKGLNQYAPMPGVPVLSDAIARKVQDIYGRSIDARSEITITAGATQALFTVISAFVHRGDEVIIFEPAYDSYAPAVELNGGKCVFVPLEHPGYKIDWDKVAGLISGKTRMIITNTPNNPGGFVYTDDDMRRLSSLLRGTDIILLSDEVYEHIIFDGLEHQSVLKYDDLYDRSIAVFSFGKTFHATGWKVGYTVAPDYLTKEIRKVHQFNVFAVNTPVQYALAEYLQDPEHYRHVAGFYEKKRNAFIRYLEASRFRIVPARGTYFQLLDYSEISDMPAFDFARKLTVETGVASIPVTSFYHDDKNRPLLRFCFAKEEETLMKAGELLSAL